MHKFDKLTIEELQNFKATNDKDIAEAYSLIVTLETHDRTLNSYIAKKRPFTWPWDAAKPLEPGCYMYKEIHEASNCAKFCTVTRSANNDLMVYFNDVKANYFMNAVGHMHWIKAPNE